VDDTALLTDDEIVALCAVDGRPWPVGLTTVDATAAELTRAGMRGMRSLMVRRLAHHDADAPGMRPHQLIADDISAFLDSTDRIGAYIAPASDHSVIAGASVTAARTPAGWVVDTTTAAGVHALRQASGDQAADVVVGLIEQAHNGALFATDEERTAWTCVVRFGPGLANVIAVSHGSATGTVDGTPVGDWDPATLRSLFAR
jgi:hypothetical protein